VFRNFRSVPRGDSFNLPGSFVLSNRSRLDLFEPLDQFDLPNLPGPSSFNLPDLSFLSNRPRPELFGPISLIWLFRNYRAISVPPLPEWCGTHARLRRGFLLVAPRVRDRLPAFPPPRGKKNLTGLSHHRQIVPGNLLSPVSRCPNLGPPADPPALVLWTPGPRRFPSLGVTPARPAAFLPGRRDRAAGAGRRGVRSRVEAEAQAVKRAQPQVPAPLVPVGAGDRRAGRLDDAGPQRLGREGQWLAVDQGQPNPF
jgi:hypothetical protein